MFRRKTLPGRNPDHSSTNHDVRREDLTALATKMSILPYAREPALQHVSTTIDEASVAVARKEVQDILHKQRQVHFWRLDPDKKFSRHFRSKSKLAQKRAFTQIEIDRAFKTHAKKQRYSLAILEALEQLGVSQAARLVAYSDALSDRAIDLIDWFLQEHSRIDQIEQAAQEAFHMTMHDIVSRETPPRVRTNEAELMSTICCIGGTESRWFLRAVEACLPLPFLSILLRSSTPVDASTMSQSLSHAIEKNDLDLAMMLLEYGADHNHERGQSLRTAIHLENFRTAVALLAYSKTPTARSVATQGLEEVLTTIDLDEQYQWLDLFRLANAWFGSQTVASRLEKAIEDGDTQTTTLLCDAGVTVSAKHLNLAVSHQDLELVKILSGRSQGLEGLDRTFLQITEKFGLVQQADLSERLLNNAKRPWSKAIDQALLNVIYQMLSEHGANTLSPTQAAYLTTLVRCSSEAMASEEEGFQAAVHAGAVSILTLLLDREPTSAVRHILLRTLQLNEGGHSSQKRLEILIALCRYSQDVQALNELLSHTAKAWHTETQFIKQLIASGANDEDLVALRIAFMKEDTKLLHTLLHNVPNSTYAEAGMQWLFTFNDDSRPLYSKSPYELCLSFVTFACQKCITQGTLDDALLRTIKFWPEKRPMVAVLLEAGAKVTSNPDIMLYALSGCPDPTFRLLASRMDKDKTFATSLLPAALDYPARAKAILENGVAHEALNDAVAAECAKPSVRLDILSSLLQHGADPNHAGGKSLQSLCLNGHADAVAMMLQAPVSAATLFNSASMVMGSGASHRYSIVKLLVPNMRGNLDELLSQVMLERYPDIDDRAVLISLMISEGADPNYRKGVVVKKAIKSRNVKLLKACLEKPLATSSICAVLMYLPTVIEADSPLRFEMLSLLLAGDTKFEIMASEMLIESAAAGVNQQHLWHLLIAKGAQVDYQQGKAILSSIQSGNRDMLAFLLQQKPSSSTLAGSVSAALKLNSQATFQCMSLILKCEPPGETLDEAVTEAARRRDTSLIELILEYHRSLGPLGADAIGWCAENGETKHLSLLLPHWSSRASKTFSKASPHLSSKATSLRRSINLAEKPEGNFTGDPRAIQRADESRLQAEPSRDKGSARDDSCEVLSLIFARMIESDTVKNVAGGLACAELLLQQDLTMRVKNEALISAVASDWSSPTEMELVHCLLRHGADVNADSGCCLKHAARSPKTKHFVTLVGNGAHPQTILDAMAELFKSDLSAQELLKTIQSCMRLISREDVDHWAAKFSETRSLTALALLKFPQHTPLFKALVDFGFDIENARGMYLERSSLEEQVNAVVFALATSVETISLDTLKTIFTLNGNRKSAALSPNYITAITRNTALHLAARGGRLDIVNLLISVGAKVKVQDSRDHSPLLEACQSGDIEVVRTLVEANSGTNDGSLHSAAAHLYVGVVRFLMSQGHDVDYPSGPHEGRTVLAEMLLHARLDCPDSEYKASEIIETLQAARSNPALEDCHRRKAIHCALHNTSPATMLKLYLRSPAGQKINDQGNLFIDSNGLSYSPTMYILEGLREGNRDDDDALLYLLRSKRCEDKFYARTGDPQPRGAIGLPARMEEFEQGRRYMLANAAFEHESSERKHKQSLQWARESADQSSSIMHDQHLIAISHNREHADQSRSIADEAYLVSLEHMQGSHAMNIQHDRERASEKGNFAKDAHLQSMKYEDERAQQQHAVLQNQQKMTLKFSEQKLLQEQRAMDARANLERQMLREQEGQARRMASIQMGVIRAQTELAREGAMIAAGLIQPTAQFQNLKSIGWVEETK